MQPPGYIPGVHIPGTTVPIGAVAQPQAVSYVFDAAAAEAQAEADRQRLEDGQAYFRREIDKVTEAMSRTHDPVERYLIAVVAGPLTYSPYNEYHPYKRVSARGTVPIPSSQAQDAAEAFRTFLLDVKTQIYDATGPDIAMWLFDAKALMGWVAQHPKAPHSTPVRLVDNRVGVFGKKRAVVIGHLPGWLIGSGNSGGGSADWNMYALADGTVTTASMRARRVESSGRRKPLMHDHLRDIATACSVDIPEAEWVKRAQAEYRARNRP